MKQTDWQRAFEPAPASFRSRVQTALSEKQSAEKRSPRYRAALILCAAVLALAGGALAASGLLMSFLRTGDTGEVAIVEPVVEKAYSELNILRDIAVTEAACDGITVHMVTTYEIDPEKGALLFGSDWDKEAGTLPFAEERAAAEQVYLINPVTTMAQSGESIGDVWDSWQYRYNSAYSVTLFNSFFLTDMELSDTVTIYRCDLVTQRTDPASSRFDTLEKASYTVTVPVQRANRTNYRITNLPLTMDGYKVNAGSLMRTDLACYLNLELEDDGLPADDSGSNLPLHGSFWLKVQPENGEVLTLLTDEETPLTDDDEVSHYSVTEAFTAFEVTDTLTAIPHDSATGVTYPAFVLEVEQE